MNIILFGVTQLLVFVLLAIAAVFGVIIVIFAWVTITTIDWIEGLLHGKN